MERGRGRVQVQEQGLQSWWLQQLPCLCWWKLVAKRQEEEWRKQSLQQVREMQKKIPLLVADWHSPSSATPLHALQQ